MVKTTDPHNLVRLIKMAKIGVEFQLLLDKHLSANEWNKVKNHIEQESGFQLEGEGEDGSDTITLKKGSAIA